MLKQVIELFDLLDNPSVGYGQLEGYFAENGGPRVETRRLDGDRGSTDLIKVTIPGADGQIRGGGAPTLGVIGRLGGLGARPDIIGFVSDGDGALVALSVAAKLARMHAVGDVLAGDVIVTTHICPNAPTRPHDPVPMMDSPVSNAVLCQHEVDAAAAAILSIDATKGNRVINHRGIAISPTVKEGYILRVSDDLLDILAQVSGRAPCVLPLSQQDITPYDNDLHHINSILQPATVTTAPVVGLALTTEVPVAGCATGASHFADIELAGRFAVEVAKAFTAGDCAFFDANEFAILQRRYGSMARFQTAGEA